MVSEGWLVVCGITDLCLAQGAIGVRTREAYQNLFLAQGGIEYGRGISGIFLFSFPFFSAYHSARGPPPVPHLTLLALTQPSLTVRIRVDLGLQHPIGYLIGPRWGIV